MEVFVAHLTIGNSTGIPAGGIDYGFWGFVLGSIATGLSITLAVLQLIERIRAKSQDREETVKVILKNVFGPIRSLAQALGSENAYPGMKTFMNSFRVYKDDILGSQFDLNDLAPQICSELVELIDLIEKETYGSWELNPSVVDNPKLKPLIGHLGLNIDKWLHPSPKI